MTRRTLGSAGKDQPALVSSLFGPLLVLYLFVTTYRERREALGASGRQQVWRRVAEVAIGIAVVVYFGRTVDTLAIRAGSPWIRLSLLAPAIYGFALSVTGLLHLIHLLIDKPGTPYKVGWLLFWIATASLALIVLIPVFFPYGVGG